MAIELEFSEQNRNQLLLGDSLTLLSELPDQFFDLIITDPPFYVLNKQNIKFKHRTDIVQSAAFDGFASYETFLTFTREWVTQVHQKMKTDSSMYIFFAAQYITDLYRICMDLGLTYKGIIVWHKTNPAPKIRKNGFLSSTELILFLQQGRPPLNFLGQNKMHNFIETPICMRPERLVDSSITKKGKHPTLHPTQKPEKLIQHLLQVSSNPGDWILDPFTGTGTTNVACQALDRCCVGIDSNAKFIQAARERLSRKSP